MPIHLEDWLWAGIDYDVRLVQFILRADQLATRIEACSIEYIHNCLPNVQDWQDWMPMLCQSIFSCNASVNGSSIDTWTDRHAIICYFSAGLPLNWRIGTGLADWHRIGRLQPDWRQIGRLALDWPIGTRLANWHQIGLDWLRLAN